MTDIVSREKRSEMMSGIKGTNTQPERVIRSLLHSQGFRYKLHVKDLPGKPDLVFPKFKAIIQIHGCFWHGHDCHLFKQPASNTQFWLEKIAKNKERDVKNEKLLLEKGWRVLTIWECAIKGKKKIDLKSISQMCKKWLYSTKITNEISSIL